MASVNKVTLVGKVGKDPEVRSFANGGKVCSFSVATSERWKDKASGEQKEKTQWHRIAIFNERLADFAERNVRKGAEVYIEGAIETRKYTTKEGQERDITEIVLARYRGELQMVGGRPAQAAAPAPAHAAAPAEAAYDWGAADDIPF
jgi:single-strand DNA-binding protein